MAAESLALELSDLAKEGKFDEVIDKTKDMDNLSMVLALHGETLLHWAAAKNNVEALEYLVGKKCYVNMVNFYSATPLYYAAMEGSLEAVKFLIDQKADPGIVSAFSGEKPAGITSNPEIRELLISYAEEFEDLLRNLFSHFHYMCASHWRISMQVRMHPNGEGFYSGYQVHPMVELLDLSDVIEECKKKDVRYLKYLSSEVEEKLDECLICQSTQFINGDASLCYMCGKVPICLECQYNPDPIISHMLLLHTHNCEQRKFDSYEECLSCGSLGEMKHCRRCKVAAYCSVDCQKQDWRRHKRECSSIGCK